jgi:acetyltransferase-like isoleucine patch superfamily enzyme
VQPIPRAKVRLEAFVRSARIAKYRSLSSCRPEGPPPILVQPVLFLGPGAIVLGKEVEFGWPTSSSFYTGYCHVEASVPGARIEIGGGAQVNNNAFIKSEGPGIAIGPRALLGSHVTIYDSDFHDLRAGRRRGGQPRMGKVELGEDVFIGDRVTILKGVRIGAHSVVGAGSVVTGSFGDRLILAGNPARVVGELPEDGAEIYETRTR